MLSSNAILQEMSYYSDTNADITDFLENSDRLMSTVSLTEAQQDNIEKHLKLDIFDVEKFVEKNNCQRISNPRAFYRDNIPSSDGLLSMEIFGNTMEERSNIYGYIDLNGWFMDPSCYKTWIRMDKRIRDIVHGIETYSITDKGELIKDPKGKTGIEFLRKNINKIKFKSSDSIKRSISIKFLERNKNKMFIKKYIVIPPYYRDKNTDSRRTVGLGGINKLYNDLIIASNALTTTQDYMFDASDAMNARVQEKILDIYDWFCGNTNANIANDVGRGLSGKLGLLRSTAMSKTTDFSTRLVISACELKVEKPEDMMVNFEYSALPLSATMVEFRDFVIFHVKKFFENEFMGVETYPIIDKNGNQKYVIPDSPEIAFSDERIKHEMERFLHGYNNRLCPVEIPIKNTKDIYYMQFNGRGTKGINTNPESIYHRRLTWCDIFYIAACEAVKNKHILFTRYPIDSFSNQMTTKIRVSSTKETEQMYFNDEYYPYYPKIREEDIGSDTSNIFVDTMQLSNLYLDGCGADYDGDQVTSKGVYLNESNDELEVYIYSKQNLINFGGGPLRSSSGDVVQSVYALTKILSNTKVTKNIKFA